jgi:hypothetical protein
LDIGVLGYIGIVWPKEHSPEVRSFPPGTPCVYIYIYMCVCVYVCKSLGWILDTNKETALSVYKRFPRLTTPSGVTKRAARQAVGQGISVAAKWLLEWRICNISLYWIVPRTSLPWVIGWYQATRKIISCSCIYERLWKACCGVKYNDNAGQLRITFQKIL